MRRSWARFGGVVVGVFGLFGIVGAGAQESMPGMQMDHPGPGQKKAGQKAAPAGQKPKAGGQAEAPDAPDAIQGMQMDHQQTPGQADAGSVTQATGRLQEPENPGFRTGTSSPVPLLLGEVAKRPALGLDEFLAMADKGNPTLAEAEALVRRSGAQAKQAGLYPNPQVGYQGEQIRGGSYGGGEQGGYVQQTVVLGGKLGLRRDVYRQQQGADRMGVEEQRYRVHNDVAQAFYAALTAQELAVVRQKLLQVAEDAETTAHQLANVGQADAPDVLQAEVEAEQAKLDFATAQRRFLASFRVLAAYSDAPEMAAAPLKGELENPPQLDAEKQVEALVAGSPAVQRAEQEVKVAEARLKDARREAVPDLYLRAGEQYNGETVATGPVRAVGAQSFAEAGVNLNLWNHNQGNREAAGAEVERARQEVRRVQLELRQTAEPLAQSYQTAQLQAQRYRDELIPRARRAYELYLTKYQQAAQAYPLVLVSQRTLFETQIGYLEALREEWQTSTALNNYALAGGLTAPVGSGSAATELNLPNGGGGE